MYSLDPNDSNFDNIMISSQESDLDVEYISPNYKHKSNHKLSNSNYFGKYASVSKEKENLDKCIVLADESSNDSDEITFIRQVSKPLISPKGSREGVLQNRILYYRKQRIAKCVEVLFILALILAGLLCFIFLVSPPNKTNIENLVHNKWIDKLRYVFDKHSKLVGCDNVSVETVWIKKFPMMLSEGAIRLIKINSDDILDIVIPFGTNIRNDPTMSIACAVYFPKQKRCYGGLLALNGESGEVLWRYDAVGEMYALNCAEDLNGDGWIDCLGAGRQGTFAAVNGKTGEELWSFDKSQHRSNIMNLYTAQFIGDIDGDLVPDIVQIHGGDPLAKPSQLNRLVAKLMIFSGRNGQVIKSRDVPDKHESYYSPQLLQLSDGNVKILVGTGGETYPGGLFSIDLNKFLLSTDKIHYSKLYMGKYKGVITPPVLVDLTLDGYVDIVICAFADECVAIDGLTSELLWKFNEINMSETYATPAAGYYNQDNVPDIFIQLFVGLGYPVYFYGETLILDGKNGKILKRLARSNNVVTTSPLSVSMEGHGNDLFLYWLQLCQGHELEVDTTPFQNVPQYILSRADVCRIRFNTSTQSKYLVHGRNIQQYSADKSSNQLPTMLYDSYVDSQYNIREVTRQTELLIQQFLDRYPQFRSLYNQYRQMLDDSDSQSDSDSDSEPIDGTDDRASSPLLRVKRHNGPHDSDGNQRLISTGSLADNMLPKTHPHSNHSIDVLFSAYWSRPREISLQSREEQRCNKKWIEKESQRFSQQSPFFQYDHDHYVDYGSKLCARKYGNKVHKDSNVKQASLFNVHFGQLTVFRRRLICTCSKASLNLDPSIVKSGGRCAQLLSLSEQKWPAYLGLSGSAYWDNSHYHLKHIV